MTLNADGSPQVSIVWLGLDGDELVTAHLGAYQKVRNVQRDPRVALSVETGERDPSGLDRYLVVHGVARVQEGGAPQRWIATDYSPAEDVISLTVSSWSHAGSATYWPSGACRKSPTWFGWRTDRTWRERDNCCPR